MLPSCLLLITALSSQVTIGIGPNKVVLDFVSLGFKHLKTHKNTRNCTTDTNFKKSVTGTAPFPDQTSTLSAPAALVPTLSYTLFSPFRRQ